MKKAWLNCIAQMNLGFLRMVLFPSHSALRTLNLSPLPHPLPNSKVII